MIWPFWERSPWPDETAPAIDAAAIVRRARRLRFRLKPRAVSVLSGAYHGARPGVGLTFHELRAYEPGDDVRHLDWNVTARQGRPYVRRFVEERALTLRLIVDVSASLRFGAEGQTKADRAAQAAALLATAAARNGDRVGLVLVSDRVEVELRPAGGERHLARIIRALVATPNSSRKTDLGVALNRINRSARRALVVVIGDFLSATPLPTGPWRRAAGRNQVIALRVVDEVEEVLPDAGLIVVKEAETGRRRLVNTHSAAGRDAYAAAAAARRTAFHRWADATGVAGHDLPTGPDPIQTLTRIFHDRATRRGRR